MITSLKYKGKELERPLKWTFVWKFEEKQLKAFFCGIELTTTADWQTTLKHVGPDCRWQGVAEFLALV